MDLKSGYPFWAIKNGLLHSFSRLDADQVCDVLVIGGGITGAIAARELSRIGLSTVVVEKRDIAWGSTAASTALLQYEIDTHLTELASRYGLPDALLAYRACADAIPTMQDLAAEVRDVDFAVQDSLYIASSIWHYSRLRKEFELRQQHGFPVELLPREAVRERFGIGTPVAILSKLGARIDPYRFASRMLKRLHGEGVSVFDRTTIESLEVSQRQVIARSAEGVTIKAKQVVIASGYEAQRYLDQRVAKNRSSYAFITDPIDKAQLGNIRNTLLWESARPYLYLRTTGEGRLLVGGDDDDVDIAVKRDASVQRKADALSQRVHKLFPQLSFEPAFSWAGTFAETSDGLPFFGPHPQWGAKVLFAMAYGGNGITYSAIGAQLLARHIQKQRHPLAELFSFARLDR